MLPTPFADIIHFKHLTFKSIVRLNISLRKPDTSVAGNEHLFYSLTVVNDMKCKRFQGKDVY